MRCVCCNSVLSDYEALIKDTATGDYLDMCSDCIDAVQEISTLVVTEPKVPELSEDDPTNGVDSVCQ